MAGPRLVLRNRQRAVPLSMPALRRISRGAVAACLTHPGSGETALPGLEEVEATFVSDAQIGKIHGEFLGDGTPTDVITFAHGEILISAETAQREALAHGESLERELTRYLLHGLLHLHGHDDHDPAEAAAMWAAQEAVVTALFV